MSGQGVELYSRDAHAGMDGFHVPPAVTTRTSRRMAEKLDQASSDPRHVRHGEGGVQPLVMGNPLEQFIRDPFDSGLAS
jgi:hypothetical protein